MPWIPVAPVLPVAPAGPGAPESDTLQLENEPEPVIEVTFTTNAPVKLL